jgi:GxxExxY protein
MEQNQITGAIITAAMKVHTLTGPGLLEKVYHTCLKHELEKAGLRVQSEVELPVHYDGLVLESGYRADLIVEDKIIVELKCADELAPIHKAQLLTYLRLGNKPLGLLLNFKVVHMRDGIKRVINNKYQTTQAAVQ